MIRSVAVLGAGTMGSQIAAHAANAGLPVVLLDVTPGAARDGLERARKLRPDPFFTADTVGRITTGGFETDLPRIATADWIVEAIIEQPGPKRALLEAVDRVRSPHAIVSSNTSGIPLCELAEGRSEGFRRHWLGTHFFNPPRYLKLVELIPIPETDPAVVERMRTFADHRLGKGVVVAKDTPNFIANHLGLYGLIRILEVLETGRFTIEEIDEMTGPAIGRPKSATFRTLDITGIDILGHVSENLARRAGGEPPPGFALPRIVRELIRRGWLGEKSGQGFYRKVAKNGGSEILTLDPATFEYRPRQAPRLPALDAAKSIDDPATRIRTLFLGRDRVGEFLRETLGPALLHAAEVAPEIAHSIDDCDRAMRWGYGWELGPFEIWDAIGVPQVLEACGVTDPPPLVRDALASPARAFRKGRLPAADPAFEILRSARDRQRVVRSNAGASLVDIGDGVLAVEFHSKMNALGADAIQMLRAAVDEAVRGFAAIVIGNDAPQFSAGANLMLILMEAQEGNWDEIDLMVRSFQDTMLGLYHAPVPVVAAPAGLTLGGGCELVLHADRVQAAAETYIGLVETGVGLIPAGGGTTMMVTRATATARTSDLLPPTQRAFETMAFAKVSGSAAHARELDLLRPIDRISMNRDRVLADAKALALTRVTEGYLPPPRRTAIPVGGEPVLAALDLGIHLAYRAGRISDHDRVVARALAKVMCGGALPSAASVPDRHLLDLERETFVSLCGEPKTRERIQHTLRTGKPLRN